MLEPTTVVRCHIQSSGEIESVIGLTILASDSKNRKITVLACIVFSLERTGTHFYCKLGRFCRIKKRVSA